MCGLKRLSYCKFIPCNHVKERFCTQQQKHRACLNDLPCAAEYYAKLLQDFHVCNEIPLGMLAKVA